MRLSSRSLAIAVFVVTAALLVPAVSPHQRQVASAAGPHAMSLPLSIPSTIPSDCSTPDAGGALANWLNSLPAYSTVRLPPNGCFNVAQSVWIHNTRGLTIYGDQATLRQPVAGPASGPIQSLLFLTQDSGLAIYNLNINGADNGSNGGKYYEGNFGLLLEADHGVVLAGIRAANIQGDCIDLNPPDSGVTGGDYTLNTRIAIVYSSFTNCGYHGVTVESVNGAVFDSDTFSNIGVDAIDFEFGVYSTGYLNGQPTFDAEDNIRFTNDTWNNFGDDWFASIQGQLPGVQEQHVTLARNTINSPAPLVEIAGAPTSNSFYQTSGIAIWGNRGLQAARSTTAGSILDPYAGSAMTFQNASNVTIAGNSLPIYDGEPGYFPNTPYLAALRANGVNGLSVWGNSFAGALGIFHPYSSQDSAVKACDNSYQVNGTMSDGSC